MIRSLIVVGMLLSRPALAQELPAPHPPSKQLQAYGYSLGAGRVAIGLAPIVAYGPATRAFGFPAQDDNPSARLMGRLFGVRDVALGALVFASMRDRRSLRRAFLFNLCIDLADAAMIAIPLVGRDGLDRPAGLSMGAALGGGSLWTVGWVLGGREEHRQGATSPSR